MVPISIKKMHHIKTVYKVTEQSVDSQNYQFRLSQLSEMVDRETKDGTAPIRYDGKQDAESKIIHSDDRNVDHDGDHYDERSSTTTESGNGIKRVFVSNDRGHDRFYGRGGGEGYGKSSAPNEGVQRGRWNTGQERLYQSRPLNRNGGGENNGQNELQPVTRNNRIGHFGSDRLRLARDSRAENSWRVDDATSGLRVTHYRRLGYRGGKTPLTRHANVPKHGHFGDVLFEGNAVRNPDRGRFCNVIAYGARGHGPEPKHYGNVMVCDEHSMKIKFLPSFNRGRNAYKNAPGVAYQRHNIKSSKKHPAVPVKSGYSAFPGTGASVRKPIGNRTVFRSPDATGTGPNGSPAPHASNQTAREPKPNRNPYGASFGFELDNSVYGPGNGGGKNRSEEIHAHFDKPISTAPPPTGKFSSADNRHRPWSSGTRESFVGGNRGVSSAAAIPAQPQIVQNVYYTLDPIVPYNDRNNVH